MKFILICATGRSGSTTLQRIINTIPGADICGENCNTIHSLLEVYKRIKITNNNRPNKLISLNFEEREKTKIKPCWYNSYDFEQMKNHIKKMIVDFLDKTGQYRVIGFKEILSTVLIGNIDLFIELFPNTKIIFHIKNDIEKQSKSGWFVDMPNSKNIILEYNNKIINKYNTMKSQSFLSTFENMFNEENLKKLFEYLEEPYNKDQIELILENKME